MILLIDSGNTRLKWATFKNGKLQNNHVLNNQDLTFDRLNDAWKNLTVPNGRSDCLLIT